jgi:hypothetical protein
MFQICQKPSCFFSIVVMIDAQDIQIPLTPIVLVRLNQSPPG